MPEGLSGTGNEGERGEAKLREGYVVVRKAVYDKASSTSPTPVVEAVFELFPDLYETKRQAKRAAKSQKKKQIEQYLSSKSTNWACLKMLEIRLTNS